MLRSCSKRNPPFCPLTDLNLADGDTDNFRISLREADRLLPTSRMVVVGGQEESPGPIQFCWGLAALIAFREGDGQLG